MHTEKVGFMPSGKLYIFDKISAIKPDSKDCLTDAKVIAVRMLQQTLAVCITLTSYSRTEYQGHFKDEMIEIVARCPH